MTGATCAQLARSSLLRAHCASQGRFERSALSAPGDRLDAITPVSAHDPWHEKKWQYRFVRVLRVDHVQLAMPPGREAEARAFYSGLLGIPETEKPPNLAVRGGCWFENDAVKVHLGVEADFHPARKAHPALIVDDVASLVATMHQAGVTVRAGEPLDGYTRVYVDDPFGNRIELMEPHASL